jgi:hypothetical protein
MIGTCYLFPIFRPINVLFHLLLYSIFLHLFFGIRGFSDAILLTSPVIRYPCMITCPVEWRYSYLAIKSNRVILNVCLMSGRLLNRRGGSAPCWRSFEAYIYSTKALQLSKEYHFGKYNDTNYCNLIKALAFPSPTSTPFSDTEPRLHFTEIFSAFAPKCADPESYFE